MKILQGTGMMQAAGGTGLELVVPDDLRVPKREVAAEIRFTFAGRPLHPCLFYLSYYSPRRQGEESLSEHLNSGQQFFPLRDKDSREFFIVHVDQILYVRETVGLELKQGRRFQLYLDRGPSLSVSLAEPQRTWPARPIDLLNEGDPFISFVQDDHVRLHVNKHHIARVGGL